jgi:hypothetical protein
MLLSFDASFPFDLAFCLVYLLLSEVCPFVFGVDEFDFFGGGTNDLVVFYSSPL